MTKSKATRELELERVARERAAQAYHDHPSHPEYCPREKSCPCEEQWRDYVTPTKEKSR